LCFAAQRGAFRFESPIGPCPGNKAPESTRGTIQASRAKRGHESGPLHIQGPGDRQVDEETH
jgi:hypothetical protein